MLPPVMHMVILLAATHTSGAVEYAAPSATVKSSVSAAADGLLPDYASSHEESVSPGTVKATLPLIGGGDAVRQHVAARACCSVAQRGHKRLQVDAGDGAAHPEADSDGQRRAGAPGPVRRRTERQELAQRRLHTASAAV